MTERAARSCTAAALLPLLGLLGMAIAHAATPEHVCVPADGGGWACGDQDAPPAPAALPSSVSASSGSAPPLLLIDPKRFRLDAQQGATAPAAPAPAEPAAVAVAAAPAPAPAPEPEPPVAVAPTPTRAVASAPASARATAGALAGNAEFAALTPGQYTLQLAAASTPDGFPALLQRLGLSQPAWQLHVQRGDKQLWLLALGAFADAGSARAAAPAAVAGAFPKPVVQLQSELAPF